MKGRCYEEPRLLGLFVLTAVLLNGCFGNHDTNSTGPPEEPTAGIQSIHACDQSEAKFVYTPCDEQKHRWRVSVPKDAKTCRLNNPAIPVAGKKCGFVCPVGNNLDISTQQCKPCPAGTYSVGGKTTFSKWDTLPEGFKTWGLDPEDDNPDDSETSRCKGRSWKANGAFVSSAGDECKSILVYAADLEKEGNLTFTYRSQTDSSYFHVYAVNSWCSDLYNQKQQVFPALHTEWKTASLPLQSGRNIIFFGAAYFNTANLLSSTTSVVDTKYDSSEEKSVEIKSMTITGLPYSSKCTDCRAGTYSAPGASECKECQKNTFSLKGASVCTSCGFDQYSDPGSSSCENRRLCTRDDYYETWTSCDSDMQTRHIYAWVQPKICDSEATGAAPLPHSSGKVECPPCNPGQYYNHTKCAFCPGGTYGNGAKACSPCPVSTTPNTGIYFRYWTSITNHPMKFGCYSKFERACTSDVGWQMSQNYADSGTGHSDDAELVMMLTVPKFSKERSLFIMEFSLDCVSQCRLTLQEYHYRRGLHTVRTWTGKTEKTKFIHRISTQERMRFRLSFEKPYTPSKKSFDHSMDRVKLYSLNITNAVNGGAAGCEECSLGRSKSRCITCGGGKYVDKNNKCQTCADGFFFNATIGADVWACQKCPEGTLVDPSGTGCYSDCHVYKGGRHFDLTKLAGSISMRGANVFTGKGFPYYHLFNISICGVQTSTVQCINNVSLSAGDDDIQLTKIVSAICRSTVIPSKREGNLLTQAVSVADSIGTIHYGNAVESDLIAAMTNAPPVPTNESMTVSNSTHEDLHFVYRSATITPHCTAGFSTIVTLRCDPTAKGKGVIKAPEHCPQGTCDGCIFHLFWHTENACPQCTWLDYDNITAACKDGKVRVHHIWKDNPMLCRGGAALPADETRACTIFETPILDFKIFLMIFLILAVLLLLSVVFLCYRNRRLRYKYHRLVDGAVKDGELPGVEQCTLEQDEDEEDDVIMSRNPRGTNHILDRLKKFKGKNNFDEFETMQMRSPSDDDL